MTMRTPIRPVPMEVARWISRMRWLRILDGFAAWTGVWGMSIGLLGPAMAKAAVIVALVLFLLGFLVRPVRVRWRPISGWTGVALSRGLKPGDRAWYVRGREADLVLITACHGLRVVIGRPDLGDTEGLSVRRTRVLLLPAEEARSQ